MSRGSERSRAAVAAMLEMFAIFAVFAASGAWPVPDLNEAVYLTKALHFADRSWAAGDFFLETPDAHGVFYRLLGPLTATTGLEVAAWVGRILGWLALAGGFRHAVAPLLESRWSRILAAAVWAVALRQTTMAGEWVIGGCEAKVFAWALVLLAIGELAVDRFARSWLAFGLATAIHPIVGGWGLVALVASRPRLPPPTPTGLTLIAIGAAAAACGIVPALGLSAADPVTRAAAARVYVVERLPHHLLLRSFLESFVARHLLAVACWWLLDRACGDTAARRRFRSYTLAALSISLCGVLISSAESLAPGIVHGLLRYYWFRLADVIVPLALAVSLAAVLAEDAACRRIFPLPPRLVRGACMLLLCIDIVVQSRHWPLPGRSDPSARADSQVEAAAWTDVCGWVRENTSPDACFLTPRGSTTFTWRTGRREVVSWKNSPQDAPSLLEWRRRIVDCFSKNGSLVAMERSTAALGPDRIRLIRDRYQADHAIVPLETPGIEHVPGKRLYTNDRYAVYRLARGTSEDTQ